MYQSIIFKPRFRNKFMCLFEAIIFPLALIYMWIITSKQGWVMAQTRYGHEFVYYHFYNYFIAIILIPLTIGNIKKYLTLKKCKVILYDDKIHLYTLKRKYITKKQRKGLINKYKCLFYPTNDNSEYYNILNIESILYKDIISVDTIKNLKVKMTYSHVNDLGILTKDEKYFIDSTLYSKKDIQLIKDELLKRCNV